jgi:hypothetical protein
VKHRDPVSLSGALAYACVLLGDGHQTEGARIIGKACGKSVSTVNQWIEMGTVHLKNAARIDTLCYEKNGERPMAAALKAMTARPKIQVSVRNMCLRIVRLAGRVAEYGLIYATTGCCRARDSMQRNLGKMALKIAKMNAGISR